MSHFTVLVIGENIERQLQPFHEFECTGIDDEFVQEVDITAEVQERLDSGNAENIEDALSWWGLDRKIVADESELYRGDTHKYGFAIVQDGKLIKAAHRTNPNKKWDWWRVGGRWAGFFKLKPGATGVRGKNGVMQSCANEGPGYADQVRKGDVDFEAMRDAKGQSAGERYDQIHAVIAGRDWQSWDHLREVVHKGDINAARVAYNSQPVVADLNKADLLGWGDIPDAYRVTREKYVDQARAAAISTFAVLKDGQWFERGRMGWWATVSDEKDIETWAREFGALIDSLPDDTLLTLVDCHI